MEYIHCHQCYRRFGPDIKFYITSCGHIFCRNCSPSPLLARCLTCSVANVQAVPIDKQMPASVAVYFSKNLAEEQNLLTKKYEFQLFQFKHLYKHLVNNEKRYEMVCREIDKNLTEFKKCTTYLKLPKCTLLTGCTGTPVHKRGTTPSSHHPKVANHLKQLPFLPSPVGSSFSEVSNQRASCKPGAPSPRHPMNSGHMLENKIRRESSQAQLSHSQSLHNMSHYQRDLNGSMCSVSSSHVALASQHRSQSSQPRPSPRTAPSPQFNSLGRHSHNGGSQRSHPARPLQRTESMSSSLSHMSTSTRRSDSQTPSGSSRGSVTSEQHGGGSHAGRYMPQQNGIHRARTPQEMIQRSPNGYPLLQRTNLQLQRGVVTPQHRGHASDGNSMRQVIKRPERMPSDRKPRVGNESYRMPNGMVSGNRCNQEQQAMRCIERGDKQFVSSPFIQYRKPLTSPALPNTPLSTRNDSQTPSSGEQRPYRLVSPRTSSSLSSSNSHTRQEGPYKRPPGPTELRTPSQSPRYQRQPPAPFQETLKILTAAVKKSTLNSQ